MSARAAWLWALACALMGGWLPSLWLPRDEPGNSVRIPELPALPVIAPAAADWRTTLRSARAPSAIFQAVCDQVPEHGDPALLRPGSRDYPYCPEAQELALYLAAEAAGRRTKDGASLLKSLGELDDWSATTTALQGWAETSPDAALAFLLAPENAHQSGVDDVLRNLATKNPDKALAALKSLPFHARQWRAWESVLTGCVDHSQETALAAIRSAPEDCRADGIRALLHKLAATDPRAALQWCENAQDLDEWTDEFEIFKPWAEQDPATALQEWLAHDHNPDNRADELAAAWADRDPNALFQWALEHRDTAGRSMELAVEAMAGRDPQRAIQMLEQAPAGFCIPSVHSRLLADIAETRMESDPAGALTWMRSLPAEHRSYVMERMLPQIQNLPPEQRRTLAEEMGFETPVGFRLLAQTDRAEAENVLAALPADQGRSLYWNLAESGPSAEVARYLEAFLRTSGEPSAGTDTTTAADDGDEEGSDPGAGSISNRVSEVAARWAAEDPVAAAAWVDRLPPDSFQAEAAVEIAHTWGRYDLAAARAWVDQLPAGTARDKARTVIAEIEKSAGP